MKLSNFTIMIIMLTLIFAINTTPSMGLHAQDSKNIKVGLRHGNSAGHAYSLKTDNGFILCSTAPGSLVEETVLEDYSELQVVAEQGQIVLKDKEGAIVAEDLPESILILPIGYQDQSLIAFENDLYRGGILVILNPDESLTAINYLSMEHYLYGVLNAEIHHAHPREALKAQAVAARSFATLNKGKHKAAGFDVCYSTHCQVYRGYSGEYEATNQAVDETFGEMITYNGRPVAAYYFKNSGGHTQDVLDVWSRSEPYLVGVEDEFCPDYPWNVSFTYESIKSRLESAGYSLGNVESVQVKERNKNGHVYNLEIVGSQSTVNLTKEKIRDVLGATMVKSLNFTIKGGTPQNQGGPEIHIFNGTDTAALDNEAYIICSNGIVSRRSTNHLYASNGKDLVKLIENDGHENGSQSQGVTFKGFGYGHGVGMPQDSAIEMAKAGYGYQDILKKYYTDIEISPVNTSGVK